MLHSPDTTEGRERACRLARLTLAIFGALLIGLGAYAVLASILWHPDRWFFASFPLASGLFLVVASAKYDSIDQRFARSRTR